MVCLSTLISGVFVEAKDEIGVSVNIAPEKIIEFHEVKAVITIENKATKAIYIPTCTGEFPLQHKCIQLDTYLIANNKKIQPKSSKITPDKDLIKVNSNELKDFNLVLSNYYSKLTPDTYTFFIGIELLQEIAGLESGEEYRKTQKIYSNHVSFKILSTNQQQVVEEWINKRRTSETSVRKLEAMIWLKDNVFSSGMTENDIKRIFGEPTYVSPSKSWVYRVENSGLSIKFEKELTTRISGIEF